MRAIGNHLGKAEEWRELRVLGRNAGRTDREALCRGSVASVGFGLWTDHVLFQEFTLRKQSDNRTSVCSSSDGRTGQQCAGIGDFAAVQDMIGTLGMVEWLSLCCDEMTAERCWSLKSHVTKHC